ncbi:MAG: Na+/H+ antiporter NhaA [Gammaproteobacteria bacterium]|nr:MAG: Na+/H+ antiporter NhaA [Gammaproteobacteria bacterium]
MHNPDSRKAAFLIDFFQKEYAGGVVLMISALLALVCANSPLQTYYSLFLDSPVELRIGALEIAKPLLLWINDGLMAIFFFLVGLELKRELLEGALSRREDIILPGIGAIGGMVVPALIYVSFNLHSGALSGWAIPAATDIAFALGVLTLLGSRVPVSIKVFLTSLAVFDDIGAIVVIALFYTSHISMTALVVVLVCILVLIILNRMNVDTMSPYVFIGIIMWTAMLKSGVHATLAGIILAMFVPIRSFKKPDYSPLKSLEHDLHPVVAFLVLPLFGFANSGINFSGVGMEQVLHPVPLGISLGLLLGKPIGIFGICWLAVRLKLTRLPLEISWKNLFGTAILCGIGFTMSLFIGSLAFEQSGDNLLFDERLGIIIGSLFSGIVGFLILRATLKEGTLNDRKEAGGC